MTQLKAVVGWSWALLCIVLVPAVFMSDDKLAHVLVRATGIHISARYSGGEIAQTLEKDAYKVIIHRPVFDGLFRKRSAGFIQADFVQTTFFPPEIKQSVSYNEDGPHSFEITLTTATPYAEILSTDPHVLGVDMLATDGGKIMLRVKLKR